MILNFDCGVDIANTLGEIVVEVLVTSPHPADVEREVLAYRLARFFQIIVHSHLAIGQHHEIGHRLAAAGFFQPGIDIRLKNLKAIRVHINRNETVNDLRRGLHTGRRDGGGHDLQIGIAMQNAF